MTSPKLIAHRGYSSKYPENTLASIQAALDAGATYIEFDLQMIADDEFILMHDPDLQRSSGLKKSIFSLTRSTARNFNADYTSQFSGQFSGIKIPLLENILSLFKQFPKAIPLVEIKDECLEEYGVDHVMKHLLPELKSIKDRCYIISFSYDAINYVKNNSDFKTGYVLPKYSDEFHELADRLNPDLLICNYKKLPGLSSYRQLPEDALWPGDWLWGLYLIGDAELALEYGNSGVDFIETDHIGLLLQHDQFSAQIESHVADEDD